MSIEAVEALLDETQESIEQQREIDALLAGNVHENFEEELENELAQLLAENGEPAVDKVSPVQAGKDPLDELVDISVPKHPASPTKQGTSSPLDAMDELEALTAPKHSVSVRSESVELTE